MYLPYHFVVVQPVETDRDDHICMHELAILAVIDGLVCFHVCSEVSVSSKLCVTLRASEKLSTQVILHEPLSHHLNLPELINISVVQGHSPSDI